LQGIVSSPALSGRLAVVTRHGRASLHVHCPPPRRHINRMYLSQQQQGTCTLASRNTRGTPLA
ncbi:hypothetical protein CI238_09054, partial [Colletotrichum incanum]